MGYEADIHGSRQMLRRVEIVKVYDDGDYQLADVRGLHGEQFKQALRVQGFGSSGVPPAGSVGLAMLVGGRASQAVLLGQEHHGSREKNLGDGEHALFNHHGDKIFLYKNKIKTVTQAYEIEAQTVKITASSSMTISAPTTTWTGNTNQAGVHVDSNGPHTA